LISKEFPKPAWENEPRTLAEHLLRCRKRRGLLQREVAGLMGVCMQSVIEWEGGKALSIRMWPKVIAFLGYDPSPPSTTFGERIMAARRRFGISLKELAEQLGCCEETVGHWEASRRQPDKVSRRVLGQLIRAVNAAASEQLSIRERSQESTVCC
jgi:DNA-binding transcriptional regulator YiaG